MGVGKVNFRVLSLILILPLFIYLAYLLITRFEGWDSVVMITFGAVVFLNIVQLLPWKGTWVSLSGLWSLVVMIVLAALSVGLAGGVGLDVSAGMLLASPFLLESWIWQAEGSPGWRIVALQFAFLDGVILVAALNSLSASGYTVNSTYLVAAYGEVNVQQFQGLWAILTGGNVGVLPLQNAMDPMFVVLGGFALLGVFAPLLQPQTGRGRTLPIGSAEGGEAIVAYSPDMEMVREETRRLFVLRSPSRPPPFSNLPGLTALFASGVVTFMFVYASLLWPTMSLLPSFVILAGVLVALIAMARSSLRTPEMMARPPAVNTQAPPALARPLPAR
jgi:hypothetical protein